MRLLVLWFVAGALLGAPLDAASQKLRVDRAASKVSFAARATMHTVEGRVAAWDLDLTVPEGSELPDGAIFRAHGLSMTTDHAKRDTEMHHWMEHEKLPAVEFRLKQFSGPADARLADGELTIHGVTVPISIPVTVNREGATFSVSGEVVLDTNTFGLPQFRKFGMLTVDTHVKVQFSVTGQLE